MKKLLICTLLLFSISFISFSQKIISTDNEIKELKDIVTKYTYVTIVSSAFKMVVSVETETGGIWNFYDVTEQKQLKFTSSVQVFNFMYRNGWILKDRLGISGGAVNSFLFEKKE